MIVEKYQFRLNSTPGHVKKNECIGQRIFNQTILIRSASLFP